MCGGEQVAEKGDDLGGGKGVRAGHNRVIIFFTHKYTRLSKNLLPCIPVYLIPYVLPFITELLKVYCSALLNLCLLTSHMIFSLSDPLAVFSVFL